MKDAYQQLREKMDGSDGFMEGHQIKKIRMMERPIPVWAKNDAAVQALLLKSFPRLKNNPKHRKGAARWMRVIQLYFRMQKTHGQVAKELKISLNKVRMIIRAIKWVAAGKRANGTGSLGNPRGRKLKELKRDNTQTTYGEQIP